MKRNPAKPPPPPENPGPKMAPSISVGTTVVADPEGPKLVGGVSPFRESTFEEVKPGITMGRGPGDGNYFDRPSPAVSPDPPAAPPSTPPAVPQTQPAPEQTRSQMVAPKSTPPTAADYGGKMPRIGSPVWYWENAEILPNQQGKGTLRCLPAILIEQSQINFTWRLNVIRLAGAGHGGFSRRIDVPYSATPKASCWAWPTEE